LNPAEIARFEQASRLAEEGKLEQARAIAQRSLAANPDAVEWIDLMRTILGRLRLPQQAIYYAQKAAALAPHHAGVLGELAMLQHELGKSAEAEATFRRAIAAEPGFAQGRSALLAVLIGQDRLAEAEVIAQEGLALDPDHGELNMKLGAVEMETLRMREAFERLAAMRFRHGGGQLAHDRLVEYQATLANYAGLHAEETNDPLTPGRIAALHREAGSIVDPGVAPNSSPSRPSRTGALRVAVLSPDLRRHPVAFFIEPLLRNADRKRIELVAVSTGAADEVTERLKPGFAQWHDASRLSPRMLNKAIRDIGCDVLLELAGLTISHVLAALADHPAPVQASYLGYPNTTGCRFIDYRIVDSITDPPGLCDTLCTEKLVRIDPCFLCYRPPADAPAPAARPAVGPVTFCCFNRLQKISRQTLSMWAQILGELPDARIVLKDGPLKNPQTMEVVRRELARWGVDPRRIDLLPMTTSSRDHWESFNRCHIALDPYPYHGTTTTCEALMMGTPVVSLAGPTHIARVGASILAAAGAPELIAQTPQAYVGLAVSLARDPARMAHYHATLPGLFRSGAICNEAAFAERMTVALERMANRTA
jgi:predicted O-linked N-acetylglucosamine transferase (SPINDLY family)